MYVARTTLALLLVGIGLPAVAQSFNLRIDPFGLQHAETAFSVEVMDDGNYLVVAGAGFDDGQFFYSSVVTSIIVDPTGSVLGADHFWYPQHATYPGLSNSMDRREEGGYVIGGSTFRSDSLNNWIQRPGLFFLNEEGGVASLIELGPENQSWIGRQAKQTPDGGYVICGETSSVGNALQAFVIKTDAQGSEEWTRTYGGPWNDYCNSVEPRSSGGYFIGGQKRVTASNPQIWVAALNDTGGTVWSREWGGQWGDVAAHVEELTDGNILVACGLSYGSNGPYRRYMAKLDASDGSFIWQREYANPEAIGLLRVAKEITPNGDLIACGLGSIGVEHYGNLLRTTSTGDSLWLRYYQYSDSQVSNIRGILYDAVPTPDGGFVAVGMVYPSAGFSQDIWVVKVDSMGCLEPGCHLITGMETQITNLGEALRVWPNPVARGTPVQVELQLPEGFVVQGQLRLTVTDAAGRLVREEHFTPHTSQRTLYTSFNSGLYHLHLHDNTRWIAGTKLVVQ
jgi:hypothetical protein